MARRSLTVPRADAARRRPGRLPRRQGHEPAHHVAQRDAKARAGPDQEGVTKSGARSPAWVCQTPGDIDASYAKVTRHVRLIVEAAGQGDLGQRSSLPDAAERCLQPDDSGERLRREPDVLLKLAFQLAQARARARGERIDGRAPAALHDASRRWLRCGGAAVGTPCGSTRPRAPGSARSIRRSRPPGARAAAAPTERSSSRSTNRPETSWSEKPSSVRDAAGRKPDRRHSRRSIRGENDRLDHLPDQERRRLLHWRARAVVTPEWPAVVEDELDATVGNDRVGGARRRAFEQPEALDERRKARRWRVFGVSHEVWTEPE